MSLLNLHKNTLRSLLREEGIKLWLEPYSNSEDGSKLNPPSELIVKYSDKMKLSKEVVETLLEELRVHSVLRFQAQQKFKEHAIATLFVTLSCPRSAMRSTAATSSSSEREEEEFHVEVKYHYTTGQKLKDQISERCGVPSNKLKLISNGKYVSDNDTLEQQNLKNLSNFLALCLSPHEEKAILDRENEERMNRAKKAAELMLKDRPNHQYELNVTDQMGREVVMPTEERKALIIAMTLHEKGKKALKQKQLSLALLYFLEADNEFSKCTGDILGLVDNYALLCLDIVWSYLLLQQITALPDAQRRLEVCEERLVKSYGRHMERVNKVRGGCNQERAIFLRLHILQGVLAFYQGDTHKCKDIFHQAEEELKKLKVDDKAMQTVMELGYSETEARLALRFSNNHVSNAIEHILLTRQEKRRVKEEEEEERRRRKMAPVLGKTLDGKDVSHRLYSNLTDMGFGRGAACHALKLHNNDLNATLEYLKQNPHPELPSPESQATNNSHLFNQQAISTLQSMGYDPNIAKAVLLHYGADIERCANHLMESGGQVPAEWIEALRIRDTDSSGGSSTGASSSSGGASTSSEEAGRDEQQRREEQHLIEEEIVQDLEGRQDEDYLDLLLEDDANILHEFQAKLASLE